MRVSSVLRQVTPATPCDSLSPAPKKSAAGQVSSNLEQEPGCAGQHLQGMHDSERAQSTHLSLLLPEGLPMLHCRVRLGLNANPEPELWLLIILSLSLPSIVLCFLTFVFLVSAVLYTQYSLGASKLSELFV